MNFSVPLLSRIMPSDTCKIYKRGCAVRMDTTLVSFTDSTNWDRGDISLIYNPIGLGSSAKGDSKQPNLVIMDNKKKVRKKGGFRFQNLDSRKLL